MKKILTTVLVVVVGLTLTLGFIMEDPFGSKSAPSTTKQAPSNPVHVSYGTPIYTDNFDGANDTTALRSRGYLIYQNSSPRGTTFWFQGNNTVFNAYNGPTTGYVGANYNATSGVGQIDVWMVTPRVAGGGIQAGDSLFFYARSTDNAATNYPDSMRVMYSVSDSTVSGTWTELGRFNVPKPPAGSGTWYKFGFRAPTTSANGRFAIRYNVSGGGPSGSNSDYIGVDALTIERSGTPPPVHTLPDLLYYRFENNPSPTLTPNFAIPGAGTNPATLNILTLTSGGQFDSCLAGTATTAARVITGYNLTTGTSSFTISFWLGNLVTPSTTRYLFGDGGHSFRCFIGGVAPSGGAILRGTGMTDVPINNIFPGPTVVHLVYDSVTTSIKVYKNGVLDNTVAQPGPLNFTAGTGFTVGGYGTISAGIEGLMDEFRFYKRRLDSAEIAATWNIDLGMITSVTPVVTGVPEKYSLSQNYPNPFNPATKINFSIPKSGLVTLKVYDVLGREVSTLVNEVKNAGTYMVDFNASNLTSGMYFYKVSVNGFSEVKKMMLIK